MSRDVDQADSISPDARTNTDIFRKARAKFKWHFDFLAGCFILQEILNDARKLCEQVFDGRRLCNQRDIITLGDPHLGFRVPICLDTDYSGHALRSVVRPRTRPPDITVAVLQRLQMYCICRINHMGAEIRFVNGFRPLARAHGGA